MAIHAESHAIGLPTNCTLLFGHIETDEEIIAHLTTLREQQERSGGFAAFIPLAYQPGKTRIVSRMASPERCLRVIALSRLMLDNIPHIKAYWPTLQIETAAVALNFGADDLDGTLGLERIMQLAQTDAPAAMTFERLEQLVRDAGQKPVRRDGRFRHLGATLAH
jgi:aminodeoxyfutalosine synthase